MSRGLRLMLVAVTLLPAASLASQEEAFQFPAPVLDAPKAPEALFQRSTKKQRAARLIAEGVTAAALVAVEHLSLRQVDRLRMREPSLAEGTWLDLTTFLTMPLLIGVDVGLVGYSLDGQSNIGWALLGSAAGMVPGLLLYLAKAGPFASVFSILFAVALSEANSYLRELNRERSEELTFLNSLAPEKYLPSVTEKFVTPPASVAVARGFGSFGLATAVGGGTALGIHYGLAAAFGCGDICRFDPLGNTIPNTMPLIALPVALVVMPLIAHLWGTWWGGRGLYLMGMAGTVVGIALAWVLAALHPALGNLWWVTAPAGAVLGWELSGLVRERMRETPDEAVP